MNNKVRLNIGRSDVICLNECRAEFAAAVLAFVQKLVERNSDPTVAAGRGKRRGRGLVVGDDGLRGRKQVEQMGAGRFDEMRLDLSAIAVAVLEELEAQAGGGDIEALDITIGFEV